MKKSLKKQAVFPVLMLLVVTALALIGSSFAWFSMASTAKLTTVSGQVEDSSVGLMISQDATHFTGSITLGADAATFVNPKYFHQMSSADGQTFFEAVITEKNADGTAAKIYTTASDNDPVANGTGKLSGWYGDPASPTKLSSGLQESGNNVNEAGYMVFDLFFSVENASTLWLDKGTSFTQDANSTAFRVAFLYMGGVTSGSAADAIALDTVSNTVIWNPAGGTSYYGVNAVSEDNEHNPIEFAPYATSAYTESVPTKTSAQLWNESAAWTEDSTFTNYTSLATLIAGVNKLRVVVWLEGNDASCTSQIALSAMSFNMNFFAKKVVNQQNNG